MAQYHRSKINRLTRLANAAAIDVHRHTGPGLFESVYQSCMTIELRRQGLSFVAQPPIDFVYRGQQIELAFKPDFIVEGLLIIEIKAVAEIAPIHVAQVITYLKLADAPVGLLLNFNAPVMKAGIRRLLNPAHEIIDHLGQSSKSVIK